MEPVDLRVAKARLDVLRRRARETVAGAVVLCPDDRDRRIGLRLLLPVDVGGEKPVADKRQHVRSISVEEEAHGPCRLAVHHLVLLEGVHPDSVLDGRSELARRENV